MDKNLKYKILGKMDLDLFYLIFYTYKIKKNIFIFTESYISKYLSTGLSGWTVDVDAPGAAVGPD